MYVQFCEMVSPDVDDVKTQQTPNPAAQEPDDDPPLELHSLDVKQVPFRRPDAAPELWVINSVLIKSLAYHNRERSYVPCTCAGARPVVEVHNVEERENCNRTERFLLISDIG